MQRGTEPPGPTHRVQWPHFSGTRQADVIEAPRVDEGCLVLKVAAARLLWVPLHTVTGPIEVEAL